MTKYELAQRYAKALGLDLYKKSFKGNKFRISRRRDLAFYDTKTLDEMINKMDELLESRKKWSGDPLSKNRFSKSEKANIPELLKLFF